MVGRACSCVRILDRPVHDALLSGRRCGLVFLVFFIQAEPYIGITPGCAASESGVTSPELLIMFPYGYLERF